MFKYLSLDNRKLRHAKSAGLLIASFNLPAVETCPHCGPCRNFCYAQDGCYRFPGPRSKRARSYDLTKGPSMFEVLSRELRLLSAIAEAAGLKPMLRLHDSGDFYSRDYAIRMMAVVRAFPKVKFYAYTKEFVMLKTITTPSNFHYIQSMGGQHDHLIDLSMPHAIIVEKEEDIPAGYTNGSVLGDLPAALGITNLALLIHGQRRRRFRVNQELLNRIANL